MKKVVLIILILTTFNYLYRGILIDPRWDNFVNFLEDMGERPSIKHSLDRINSNGNYGPGSCKWSTRKEQQNNTRQNRFVFHNGQKYTIAQFCEKFNLKHGTIRPRIVKQGWSAEMILDWYKPFKV